MKPITNTILEKLNKLENFTLRYNNGADILWNINAPGLNVLLVSHQYMTFTGETGKNALLYHSARGDFFNKTYDILYRAGINKELAPDVWGYIRELEKYASTTKDIEAKANANLQLFRFIQEFLENMLFSEYVERTENEIEINRDIFKKLIVAADSFVFRDNDGNIQIMAGYPWFDQNWGRDTFIGLNGILLVTGRFEYAKSVFTYFAQQQNDDGLLPKIIFFDGKKEYNSADASLWFIEALKKYSLAVRNRDGATFIKKMIPVVNKIIDGYLKTSGNIHIDADNLIVVPAQWTWMDAAPQGKPITPRNGKPIEIQALFYNALSIASEFNNMSGNKKVSLKYDELRKEVGKSINIRYFEYGRIYPFDVLDGDENSTDIRPNAVFLLSLTSIGGLIPEDRQQSIIDVIEKELLTSYGLRSLSSANQKYSGKYDTFASQDIKDFSYHQGTIWPWLMPHYITAKLRISAKKSREEIINDIRLKISNLIYTVKDKDTVPELFSGSEPYQPGGTVSQMWSVASMLEILHFLNNESVNLNKKLKHADAINAKFD